MYNYYYNISKYIEFVILPTLLVYEILYINQNNINISFIKTCNRIKKIVNIKDINYHKVKYITNNILVTKYNYQIISYRPIKLSYVINK